MEANRTHQHSQTIKLTEAKKHSIQIQPHVHQKQTKNNNLRNSVCSGCNA